MDAKGGIEMKKSYIVIFAALLLVPGVVLAQPFDYVDDLVVSPPPSGTGVHGIAQVGDEWFLGNFEFGGWHVYDSNFNQTGSVVVSPPIGTVRGLCYDANAGTMFVGEYSAGMIHETTTAGVILNSFPTVVSGFNALAFDADNDYIFAVGYQGQVEVLTRTGTQMDLWTGAYNWTGAACDWVNDTILLMEGDDRVLEYEHDGTLIEMVINADCVPGNGQGLAYDSFTGILHCTGQYGEIGIWEREVVTATESTSWSGIKALY
jgi:hypothetical protein